MYLPKRPDISLIATNFVSLMDYYAAPLRAGGADYPKAFAIGSIMMLPPIILFMFVQKQFIEGLSMGRLKVK